MDHVSNPFLLGFQSLNSARARARALGGSLLLFVHCCTPRFLLSHSFCARFSLTSVFERCVNVEQARGSLRAFQAEALRGLLALYGHHCAKPVPAPAPAQTRQSSSLHNSGGSSRDVSGLGLLSGNQAQQQQQSLNGSRTSSPHRVDRTPSKLRVEQSRRQGLSLTGANRIRMFASLSLAFAKRLLTR